MSMTLPLYISRKYLQPESQILLSILATTDVTFLPQAENALIFLRLKWYTERGVPWTPWVVEPDQYKHHNKKLRPALADLIVDGLVVPRNKTVGPYGTMGLALTNVGEEVCRSLLGQPRLAQSLSAYRELCDIALAMDKQWVRSPGGDDVLLPALTRGMLESRVARSSFHSDPIVEYRVVRQMESELDCPSIRRPGYSGYAMDFFRWRITEEAEWLDLDSCEWKEWMTGDRDPWGSWMNEDSWTLYHMTHDARRSATKAAKREEVRNDDQAIAVTTRA